MARKSGLGSPVLDMRRLKISDCIKGNVSEVVFVHSSACSVCVPWTFRDLSVGAVMQMTWKSVLGSAVLERRGCRCGMAVSVVLMRSCALPGCSVCIA